MLKPGVAPILQLLGTLAGAFLTGIGLQTFKDWRSNRARVEEDAEEREGEERDWQLRCMRTEEQFRREVEFTRRLDFKITKFITAWRDILKVLETDDNPKTNAQSRQLAFVVGFYIADMEAELGAHRAELEAFRKERFQGSDKDAEERLAAQRLAGQGGTGDK